MKAPPSKSGNALLDRLSKPSRERMLERLTPIELTFDLLLYEARSEIEYAYFPTTAVLSALVVMRSGAMIEVGTVGKEGAVGLPSGPSPGTSPNRIIVQIGGSGLQIDTAALKRLVSDDRELGELFLTYNLAFQFQVSQSVACNGLHQVQQRCARWLLMTHDRVDGDDISLTHEYLAAMIGVRRAGVGEVLQELQHRGLIDNGRHKITILDRKGMEQVSCECYQDVQNEYRRLLG
jgi:hypothetical protein